MSPSAAFAPPPALPSFSLVAPAPMVGTMQVTYDCTVFPPAGMEAPQGKDFDVFSSLSPGT